MSAEMLAIGGLWFCSSAVFSTWANTAFLNRFRDPVLHTLIRFAGSAIIGGLSRQLSIDASRESVLQLMNTVAVPAVLLFIANCANSVALQAAGVTLTYVVKASIPVFTVLICYMRGQSFPFLTYVSLIPICAGVALASASDMNFSTLGLVAALISALAQTLMNLSIKSIRTSTGMSGSTAFFGMTVVSTLVILPIAIAHSVLEANGDGQFGRSSYSNIMETYEQYRAGNTWPLILVAAAALAYHIEYALNFVFVAYVSPVAFSVSDIARRIAIIITGATLFNKVLTQSNWLGIIIALSGVLWYSYLESQPAAQNKTAPKATPARKPRTPKKQVDKEGDNNSRAVQSDIDSSKTATPARTKSKSPSRAKKDKKLNVEVSAIPSSGLVAQTPVEAPGKQRKKKEPIAAEAAVLPAPKVSEGEKKKRGRPTGNAKQPSNVVETRNVAAVVPPGSARRSERIFLSS
jgi:drug/metabolite transporter (DMT)-like permease